LKNNKRSDESEIDSIKKLIESVTKASINKNLELKNNKRSDESEIDGIKKLIESVTKASINKNQEKIEKKKENEKKKTTKKPRLMENFQPIGFLTERQLRNNEWPTDREIVFFS